jgi:antitoxin component HigA of HigAB toxin-antitoxin module
MKKRSIETEEDYRAAISAIDTLTAGDRKPAEGTAESADLKRLTALVHAYKARRG